VDHRLLVTRGVIRQELVVLVKRLPKPGNIAVPEDPKAPDDQARPVPIALALLRGEEPDQRLADR
jgi:hypothetical protein